MTLCPNAFGLSFRTHRVYVNKVDKGTYDLNSCLTLLRLYSFSPEHVNIKVIGKILIKAMLRLPSPDFALMLHLIPERQQVDPQRDKLMSEIVRWACITKVS